MWATGSVYGDGSEATVGYHGLNRAISPLGFPGFNEPARKYIDDIVKEEKDDANAKPYQAITNCKPFVKYNNINIYLQLDLFRQALH